MAYLLALDQGTTSSRAIVFDHSGRIVALAQEPFEQHFPHPGWVEHDPTEIWHTQLATARAALEQAGLTAGDLAAVGITNQRETVVLWERSSGRPVSHAIVWQDRRTAELTDRMKREGLEAQVRAKTGLVLDPYFSASKLTWLLEDPGLRRRAEAGELAFGTIDSWLVWNLTGGAVHATDVSNASRTLLFDIHAGRWDDELLALFRVPRAVLPEVRPSVGDFGVADPQWLGGSVPIHGVLGDQQAALFGQACFEAGMAKNTYGTGAFLVMNTGDEPLQGDGVLTTVAWRVRSEPLRYALEGSIFVAGAAVQWLRDGLGLIKESHEIEALAASVASSEGVYFVPALTGLGSPYWDPYARGLLVGLTRGSGRAHIARATSRPSPCRSTTRCTRWRPRECTWPPCAPTAGPQPTTCSCRSRPICWAGRSSAHASPRPRRWAPPWPPPWGPTWRTCPRWRAPGNPTNASNPRAIQRHAPA